VKENVSLRGEATGRLLTKRRTKNDWTQKNWELPRWYNGRRRGAAFLKEIWPTQRRDELEKKTANPKTFAAKWKITGAFEHLQSLKKTTAQQRRYDKAPPRKGRGLVKKKPAVASVR